MIGGVEQNHALTGQNKQRKERKEQENMQRTNYRGAYPTLVELAANGSDKDEFTVKDGVTAPNVKAAMELHAQRQQGQLAPKDEQYERPHLRPTCFWRFPPFRVRVCPDLYPIPAISRDFSADTQ